MSVSNSPVARRTALAVFAAGLAATGLTPPVQTAESSGAAPAPPGSAPAVTPRGLFFANPTFHFETLRNAGYVVSNCADLGEILETVKVISEDDERCFGDIRASTRSAVACHAMYGAPAEIRMVADNDVTSQQNVVGKYDVAADLAVMPDMRSHHKKTAVTHLGYPATVLGADAHRDIFADVTIGAHHESRRLAAVMHRLRRGAQ